jgi:hypothetical protein
MPHTTLCACRGGRVWGSSSSGPAVLDVLRLSRLVGVGEPVWAHDHVVGEADSATSHEDLGDCETARHVEVFCVRLGF